MEYGIPLADQTKVTTMPALPAQPAITPDTEQKAREGQKFAWAPNQSVQAEGITATRDDEFRSRAARVATNQAVEQTKAQTEVVKGQISVLEGEIATLNQQIGELNSQISGINSQVASVEGQISQIPAQVANQPQGTTGTVEQRPSIQRPTDVADNPNYQQIHTLQMELERMKQQGKWKYDVGESAAYESIRQQIRNLGGFPT
jgi:chromosome segregation ATPase